MTFSSANLYNSKNVRRRVLTYRLTIVGPRRELIHLQNMPENNCISLYRQARMKKEYVMLSYLLLNLTNISNLYHKNSLADRKNPKVDFNSALKKLLNSVTLLL